MQLNIPINIVLKLLQTSEDFRNLVIGQLDEAQTKLSECVYPMDHLKHYVHCFLKNDGVNISDDCTYKIKAIRAIRKWTAEYPILAHVLDLNNSITRIKEFLEIHYKELSLNKSCGVSPASHNHF